MTILLEIHINAAITGLKHQRHMETEFPCAVEQATAQALLLCKGFLSVIVHEYIYIHSFVFIVLSFMVPDWLPWELDVIWLVFN